MRMLEQVEWISPLVLYVHRFEQLLGSGQFAEVFKAAWVTPWGTKEVAIKSLTGEFSEEDKVKFLKEAAIMAQFRHPHIVRLLGAVTVDEPVGVCGCVHQSVDLHQVHGMYYCSHSLELSSPLHRIWLSLSYWVKETCCITFSNSVPSECGCRQMFPVVWATCKPHIWGMSTASLVVCSKAEWTAWSTVLEVPLTAYACINSTTRVIKRMLDINHCWSSNEIISSVLAWSSSGLLTTHCRYASAPSIPSIFSLHALCIFPTTSITASYKSATHHVVLHILQSFTLCMSTHQTNDAKSLSHKSTPEKHSCSKWDISMQCKGGYAVGSRAFLCTIMWISCEYHVT